MNKVLSMLAVVFAMLIGANAYAQSANTDIPVPAPQKQCAKSGGAAGCCKDKAAATGAACCKDKAAMGAACTKGQATAATTPACTKGQATAAEHKCAHSTSAMVQEGESQVLSAKMEDTDKKAIKASAKVKRGKDKAKATTAVNAATPPACQKGAAGKCCKDKAAAGATNNLKVSEQK
jgi:hypothetical protein